MIFSFSLRQLAWWRVFLVEFFQAAIYLVWFYLVLWARARSGNVDNNQGAGR